MVKLDLQFFGGRGSGGVRAPKFTGITEDDWFDWAEDPEIFQAALNGEKKPTVSQADGHEYTKEEWERAKQVAPEMQRMAEEGTVDHETLYRGESFESLLEARRKYKIGKTITNDKLTSYAVKVGIARDYAGANIDLMGEDAVKVVIANTNIHGKSVGVMTDPFGAGGSYEIVTPKGMKSYVKNTSYDKDTKTLYVELGSGAKPKKKRK